MMFDKALQATMSSEPATGTAHAGTTAGRIQESKELGGLGNCGRIRQKGSSGHERRCAKLACRFMIPFETGLDARSRESDGL